MGDDTVIFRDDGTVTVKIDGERHRLRCPNMGELRRLREEQDAMEAEIRDRYLVFLDEIRPLREEIAELGSDPENRDGVRALREKAKTIDRDVGREIEGLRAGWMREAFRVLADKPLTDDDDRLQPWMLTDQGPADLLSHWRMRPVGPSVRAREGSLQL